MKNPFGTVLIAFALLSGAGLGSVSALEGYMPIDPNDPQFRSAHPVRVFVDVEADGHRRGDNPFEAEAERHLAHTLPPYVQMVDSPEYADIMVRARQIGFDLTFRVVDVDHKDKKYKKRAKFGDAECGYLQKAYYTKVKEEGEARASYDVRFRTRLGANFGEPVTLSSSKDYKYGKDLRAQTKCGLKPTDHAPTGDVQELMEQADPAYRRSVAMRIEEEAAHDLSEALAVRINSLANTHYGALATQMSFAGVPSMGCNWWDNRDWPGRPASAADPWGDRR